MTLKNICFPAFALVFLCGCHLGIGDQETSPPIADPAKTSLLKYAKGFAIVPQKEYTAVYLFGNRHRPHDITASFFVYTGAQEPKSLPSKGTRIHAPCQRIAALSSIYASIFCELGVPESIVAIDNIDYVNNPWILRRHQEGKLKELARTPRIDLEQTVTLKPDILFTFGMGEGEKDKDMKLEQTGIPVAISIDHLEESPLARAEWIKFFAVFVGREGQADLTFSGVEKRYTELKALAQTATTHPTVFSEIKYSDFWYMPGGKSYVACLLKDAAADYLWKNDTRPGSLPLSFEQVFARAKDADFWINLSTLRTKKELLGFESRYAEFKAYKTGNLYNNTAITNKYGYSMYWETGMTHPDLILGDLVQIFHPELKPKINKDLYYYERLR